MTLTLGLVLVLVAGLLQGSFVLPMTLTRGWKWEQTWLVFSLLGMLLFNWLLGWIVLPHLVQAIQITAPRDISILLGLGACWGLGAILFGLGMERLGMAVGYPVIMGLILSLGALIPLTEAGMHAFAAAPGLLMLAGTAVVLLGITICARASASRDSHHRETERRNSAGLTIAIFAGIFSCLPNVGLNNAGRLTESASALGASAAMAGNAAWVVQFSAGFVVNAAYCLILMVRRRGVTIFRIDPLRNLSLTAAMAILWIGSFYLYGMGASRMGRWGTILGWPLFVSISIVAGNLWGLWRGEWKSAPRRARSQLNIGMAVVLVAVLVFGLGSAAH